MIPTWSHQRDCATRQDNFLIKYSFLGIAKTTSVLAPVSTNLYIAKLSEKLGKEYRKSSYAILNWEEIPPPAKAGGGHVSQVNATLAILAPEFFVAYGSEVNRRKFRADIASVALT